MVINCAKKFFFCSINAQFFRIVTICIPLIFVNVSCVSKDIYYDKKFNPPVYFGTHVVRKNENLYGIAWRYGRDFKELARANAIKSPYVIHPGQKIHLERRYVVDEPRSMPSDSPANKKRNVTKGKETKAKRSNVTKRKNYKNINKINWQWPHLGPILAKYKNTGGVTVRQGVNKGIDIQGELGDPIYAAAAGEVVYAGNGLLGYGNLVIINHSAQYLSAYAHNQRILVKEGQQIQKGQRIADMGRSGVDRPMLHFEIRKNGQPVNPQRYLPDR